MNHLLKKELTEDQYRVLSSAANRCLDNIQGWEGSTVSRNDVIAVVVDQIDTLGQPHMPTASHIAEWATVREWLTQNYGNAVYKRTMKNIFSSSRYSF
jgi:allophanate hydrolase subunit 2